MLVVRQEKKEKAIFRESIVNTFIKAASDRKMIFLHGTYHGRIWNEIVRFTGWLLKPGMKKKDGLSIPNCPRDYVHIRIAVPFWTVLK